MDTNIGANNKLSINKNWFLILAAVAILALLIFIYPSGKQDVKEEGKLVLVLDYGNDKQSFEADIQEQKRAWSLLQQATALSNIPLEATNDFRPKRIDGFANGLDNKYWMFYVNGIKQESSPYDTFVKSPAEVVFKFE
ncbi:DUF4430 domain-containing protein [Patescibacteria group bacterium]|nr:DUF4430 domain-containing protein [Patescibacteria group bacterium]